MIGDFFDLPKTNRLLKFLNKIAGEPESVEARTNLENALNSIAVKVNNSSSISSLVIENDGSNGYVPISQDNITKLEDNTITGVIIDGIYMPRIYISTSPFNLFYCFVSFDQDTYNNLNIVTISNDGIIDKDTIKLSFSFDGYANIISNNELNSRYPDLKSALDQIVRDLLSTGEVTISNASVLMSFFSMYFSLWYPIISFSCITVVSGRNVKSDITYQMTPTGYIMHIGLIDSVTNSAIAAIVHYSSSIEVVSTYSGSADF